MNEFMLFLEKFNAEHTNNVNSIRNILKRINDEPSMTGSTARDIIKEIRRRQQE